MIGTIKRLLWLSMSFLVIFNTHAHVLLESSAQQALAIEIGPAAGQSALCATRFSLAPFGRVRLSGGDGSYACKAVMVKINQQGPQTVDFSAIDRDKSDVVIEIIPNGSGTLDARLSSRGK